MTIKRLSIADIQAKKHKEPIVSLTAYTASFTRLLDPHCDVLLVGDTLGMVLYGMESTLGVDMDMMCRHGKAVVSASSHSCVVVDMPFGSYQESKEQAFRNAATIMEHSGCQAVKLEGGEVMAPTIEFLQARGIPVMAHIGLQPQSVHQYGGYRLQGKTDEQKKQLHNDALAVEQAGAFAVVMECIPTSSAKELTASLSIPTIGIGASKHCDGQILVTEDMAGLFSDFTPKFVQQFGDVGQSLDTAVKAYADAVKSGQFPQDKHSY